MAIGQPLGETGGVLGAVHLSEGTAVAAGTLNAQQMAAVHAPIDKPLLILAAAGSGKTSVLCHRILHLVSHGVPGREILALTFTRKAGQNLQQRLHAAAPSHVPAPGLPNVGAVRVSTFHSFCLTVLRRFAAQAGLPPGFVIFTPKMQVEAITELLHTWHSRIASGALHPGGQPPQAAPPSGTLTAKQKASYRGEALRVLRRISKRQLDTSCEPDGLQGGGDGEGGEEGEEARMMTWLLASYSARLERARAVDFGQFVPRTVRLLRSNPGLLPAGNLCPRHILVDEFQDTDSCQMALLKLLCGPPGRHVSAVGDDDQQIYTWRGASGLQNFAEFENFFRETEVMRLEHNYRSTGAIVASARRLVAANQRRRPKTMRTSAPTGRQLSLIECRTAECEAAAIADVIQELHEQQGVPLCQVAVLYRLQRVGQELRPLLRARGIKCAPSGSGTTTGDGEIDGRGGGGGGGGGGLTTGGGDSTPGTSMPPGAVIDDILAVLRLAVSQHDDLACRHLLLLMCPRPSPRVAACLRHLQRSGGMPLLAAIRATRAHFLGVVICREISLLLNSDDAVAPPARLATHNSSALPAGGSNGDNYSGNGRLGSGPPAGSGVQGGRNADRDDDSALLRGMDAVGRAVASAVADAGRLCVRDVVMNVLQSVAPYREQLAAQESASISGGGGGGWRASKRMSVAVAGSRAGTGAGAPDSADVDSEIGASKRHLGGFEFAGVRALLRECALFDQEGGLEEQGPQVDEAPDGARWRPSVADGHLVGVMPLGRESDVMPPGGTGGLGLGGGMPGGEVVRRSDEIVHSPGLTTPGKRPDAVTPGSGSTPVTRWTPGKLQQEMIPGKQAGATPGGSSSSVIITNLDDNACSYLELQERIRRGRHVSTSGSLGGAHTKMVSSWSPHGRAAGGALGGRAATGGHHPDSKTAGSDPTPRKTPYQQPLPSPNLNRNLNSDSNSGPTDPATNIEPNLDRRSNQNSDPCARPIVNPGCNVKPGPEYATWHAPMPSHIVKDPLERLQVFVDRVVVKIHERELGESDTWQAPGGPNSSAASAASQQQAGSPEQTGVTLSTIHQAKGREWTAVILARANEGVLPIGDCDVARPHAASCHPIHGNDDAGDWQGFAETEELEEERRLMYVAMTRPRRFLTITHVMMSGKQQFAPSRFLSDIPPGLMRRSARYDVESVPATPAAAPLPPPSQGLPRGALSSPEAEVPVPLQLPLAGIPLAAGSRGSPPGEASPYKGSLAGDAEGAGRDGPNQSGPHKRRPHLPPPGSGRKRRANCRDGRRDDHDCVRVDCAEVACPTEDVADSPASLTKSNGRAGEDGGGEKGAVEAVPTPGKSRRRRGSPGVKETKKRGRKKDAKGGRGEDTKRAEEARGVEEEQEKEDKEGGRKVKKRQKLERPGESRKRKRSLTKKVLQDLPRENSSAGGGEGVLEDTEEDL